MACDWLYLIVIISTSLDFLESVENLSRRSTTVTSQSSNYAENMFLAHDAVDGDESTFSLTARHQQEAWLQVDLGFTARIQEVELLHRYDVTFIRPHRFHVIVANVSDFRFGTSCFFDTGNTIPNPIIVPCAKRGQYVTFYNNQSVPVGVNSSEAFVELIEFRVFGCEANRFGQNSCLQRCHCVSGCNPHNGVCDVPGCTAGYKGTKCDQGCDNTSFGPDCNHTCHCSTPGCELVIGLCNKPGCKVGYFGPACEFTCKETNFGYNCKHECHCKTPGCHHVTGMCNIPGCEKGYSGQSCSNGCEPHQFGYNCENTCNCASTGCDDITGICEEPGCLQGYTGDSCNISTEENNLPEPAGIAFVFLLTVIGICGVLVLILILGIALCVRRKKRKKKKRSTYDRYEHAISTANRPDT